MEEELLNPFVSCSPPQESKEVEERNSTATPNSKEDEKNSPIKKNSSYFTKTLKNASKTPPKNQQDDPRLTSSALEADKIPRELQIMLSKRDQLRLVDPDQTFVKKGDEKGSKGQLADLVEYKKGVPENYEEYFGAANDWSQHHDDPKQAIDFDSESERFPYTILKINQPEELKSSDAKQIDKKTDNLENIVVKRGLEKANEVDSGENRLERHKTGLHIIGPGLKGVTYQGRSLDSSDLKNPTDQNTENLSSTVAKTSFEKADDIACGENNLEARETGLQTIDDRLKGVNPRIQSLDSSALRMPINKQINDLASIRPTIRDKLGPGQSKVEFSILSLDATALMNPLMDKEPNSVDLVEKSSNKADHVGSCSRSLSPKGFHGKSMLESIEVPFKEGSNSGPKGLKTTEKKIFRLYDPALHIFQEFTPEEYGALGFQVGEGRGINFADQEHHKACGSNWGTPDFCFKTRKSLRSNDFKEFRPIKQDTPKQAGPIDNLKKPKGIFNDELNEVFEQKLKARRLTNLEEDMNSQETHLIRLVSRTTPKKAKNTAKTITGSL